MDTCLVALPLSVPTLQALSRIIRKSGGVIAGIPQMRDYHWEMLIRERGFHDTPFRAHIDSNFLIHLLSFFDEDFRQREISPEDRRVAALMGLSIAFDVQINPTYAVHEYACTAEGDSRRRLLMFYYADNLPPALYANLALGVSKRLPAPSEQDLARSSKESREELETPLEGFAVCYMGILGILAIHTDPAMGALDRIGRKKRMFAFLDWMYSDHIFTSYSIITACALWGTRGGDCVIARANTDRAEDLMRSARNAAWDLTLVHTWANAEAKRATDLSLPTNFVFSVDKGLKLLASLVLSPALGSKHERRAVRRITRKFWRGSEAIAIADRVQALWAARDARTRRVHRATWASEAVSLERALETKIRHNLQTPT